MDEQVAELQRETRSSIEIDRNAKGDMSYKAKEYYDESSAVARQAAFLHLVEIDRWFLEKWGPKPIAPGTPDPRD